MLVAPITHLEQVDRREVDRLLLAWGHRMGPCNRPMGGLWSHVMFAHGEPVAATVTADLIRETCAGLSRSEAIELARLCAARRDLCRVMLRLWREFVFPAYDRPWAVSYQDEALHSGDTYRFDGWLRLRENVHSGTDQRSGRKGRDKTIWGWHADPLVRTAASRGALQQDDREAPDATAGDRPVLRSWGMG